LPSGGKLGGLLGERVLGGGSLGDCGGGMAARGVRCEAGAGEFASLAGAGALIAAWLAMTTGGSAVSASATGGGAGSVTKGSAGSALGPASGGAGGGAATAASIARRSRISCSPRFRYHEGPQIL
jgi:hypothetical protein